MGGLSKDAVNTSHCTEFTNRTESELWIGRMWQDVAGSGHEPFISTDAVFA